MEDIYLSEDAFWSITLAAIEVFKKECFGTLVGYKATDRWIIQRAVSHQSARRYFSSVEPHKRLRQRIERAVRSLAMGERIVGWFHSHPEWGDLYGKPQLSKQDIDYAQTDDVVLVVAIRGKKKHVSWSENKSGAISGTMGDYHLALAAFIKADAERAIPLRLRCAYAHGFNPK